MFWLLRAARAVLGDRMLPRFLLALVLGVPALLAQRDTLVQAALRDGVVHLGNGAEPRSLDPQLNVAYTDSLICQALFEGLVLIDGTTGEPVPGVAERWEVAEDGLTWTFHLRGDARWSNGDPVTSRDFAYAFRRNLSPAFASEYSYMLWVIRGAEGYNRREEEGFPEELKVRDFAQVGVETPDDRTLRLTLASPVPYLLGLIVHDSWFPVHRGTIEAHGAIDARATGWDRPGSHVGNGPFRLAEWRTNDVIRVVRNEHYWDAANVGVNEIRFYPIEDAASEERSYFAGQLHMTYKLLPESIEVHRRARPAELVIEPWLETWFLRVNVTRPVLRDRRVREALSLAIDREAIVESVTRGGQEPAFFYTPPGTGGYTSPVRLEYDPDVARARLAEAGFPGGRGLPRFTVLFNTDPENRRILEAIQEMWRRELGVEVELANMEFKTYIDAQRRLDYDISRSRWIGDYPDPDTFLGMYVTGGGNNDTGFADPAYDALIARARTLPSGPARTAVLGEAESLLMRELPVIPVFFGNRVVLRHPSLEGYDLALTGNVIYKRLRLRVP